MHTNNYVYIYIYVYITNTNRKLIDYISYFEIIDERSALIS